MITQPTPGNGFEYHRIFDTLIDPATGMFHITIGSWPDAAMIGSPFATKTITVKYASWLPEYFDQAEQTVNSNPEWTGVEPSKPNRYCYFDIETRQWVDPRTPETEWVLVRVRRDQLLSASDWTQLPDVSISSKEAWVTYRQELRDITQQTDPFNISWPIKPS
jgi:hypothetical protein